MGMTTDQWREMKRSGYDEQGEEDFDEYGMWGTDIINTNNSNYNNNILTDGFDSFNNNYSTVVYALSKIIFNNNIISTDGSDNNNNINSNKYNINFYDAFANNNKVFAIPFPFVSRTISLIFRFDLSNFLFCIILLFCVSIFFLWSLLYFFYRFKQAYNAFKLIIKYVL